MGTRRRGAQSRSSPRPDEGRFGGGGPWSTLGTRGWDRHGMRRWPPGTPRRRPRGARNRGGTEVEPWPTASSRGDVVGPQKGAPARAAGPNCTGGSAQPPPLTRCARNTRKQESRRPGACGNSTAKLPTNARTPHIFLIMGPICTGKISAASEGGPRSGRAERFALIISDSHPGALIPLRSVSP
jgi:hypothetical protein